MVEGATFLLLCHDDVVLGDTAVRVMVEEAYRSNAGIVGPKLVSADDPEVLLEVGRAHRPLRRALHRHRARRGRPGAARRRARRVLRHHRDDARARRPVRGAAGLRRRRRSPAPRTSTSAGEPGSPAHACWSHPTRVSRTAKRRRSARAPTGRTSVALARARVRVLFTSYSFLTLVWLVPVGIVVGRARGDRRPRHRPSAPAPARPSARGSRTSCTSARGGRRASARRRMRHVHDRDLRELQVGSTPASARSSRTTCTPTSGSGRSVTAGARRSGPCPTVCARPPHSPSWPSSRSSSSAHVSLITTACPRSAPWSTWPGVDSLFDAFGSAWRYTGLGSPSAAPPLLAAMGGGGHRPVRCGRAAHAPSWWCWRCRSARSAPTAWRGGSWTSAGPRSPPASHTA